MINFRDVSLYNWFFLAALVALWGCSAAAQKQISDEELLRDVTAEGLEEILASHEGERAVLVNVWATWCQPCVEEFPELLRIHANYPDELRVVLVSADFPDARDRAMQFLRDQNVDWTTYFKDDRDQPFIEALSPEWSGALPFSRIISRHGATVAEWEGKETYETFEKHVIQAINR